MDSRDITIKVPDIPQEEVLNQIFFLQKELISEYIKIEKGKPYPLNVNTKESQLILKDFTARVVEELAEGYESLLLVDKLTRKNQYWVGNYDNKEYFTMLNHLQNANEEFADAIHFMVELLVYTNIDSESIMEYLKVKYPDLVEDSLIEDPLYQSQIVGYMVLLKDLYAPYTVIEEYPKRISLLKTFNKEWANTSFSKGIDVKLLVGAEKYDSNEYLHVYKEMLWDITYHLNISRNFLRNKPWKQSQVFVDEQKYQEELIISFISMMGFFAFIGLKPLDIFYIYFKKNQVNRFRIRSKY